MRRTLQAKEDSGTFVSSTEQSMEHPELQESRDLQYSYEMTDSRPPTGMQEQHPLSVYFENDENRDMQAQDND